MITLIEARGYRALKFVRQELSEFHVLVGPNASGKTTFLDVPAFLARLVTDGLGAALDERSSQFSDLTWARSGDPFELAIEVEIPEQRRGHLAAGIDTARYEVRVGVSASDEVVLKSERVLLKARQPRTPVSHELFPKAAIGTGTILEGGSSRNGSQNVVAKIEDGNDNFYGEHGSKLNLSFKLGPRKSALANLPADEERFPVATWLRDYLVAGVQPLTLNSLHLRRASPPNQGPGFRTDGSNLPWVAANLIKHHPDRFNDWMGHLSTALRDFESLRIIQRDDDKHSYMMLKYNGGLEVPSWMASDGTLRLLALTLPAYLPDCRGAFLIEEPENGIHPRAVEAVMQSLSSVYGAQILVATHSPVVLSSTPPDKVLCFAKDDTGATDIVTGDRHPALSAWQGEMNIGSLFAAGVLG